MDDANKARVVGFLKEFKKIVVTGRGLDVIPRPENIKCLAELGLTKKNQREEILSLTPADYCEGPELDKDKPGEIWVFGKQIGGREVYMKLKIAKVSEEKIAKCISFHPARYPLCFPLRAEKRRSEK